VARILPQVGTIAAKELMRNYCDALLPRIRARARAVAAAAGYREVVGVATASGPRRARDAVRRPADRRNCRHGSSLIAGGFKFSAEKTRSIFARGRAPNPSQSMRTGSVGKFSIYQLVGSGA